jgi:dihydrodipicolinate synthase/N-acetylneuraminate lyase
LKLTRTNLKGVWAAITTPCDQYGRFDEGPFRENMRRLHRAGVHGIYTTDSDGEFYAIELDEFREIVDVFADEAAKLGALTQVGITWVNTDGMLQRLRHAADRGIHGAHVGHPFFMPMTEGSYQSFWADVQAATPNDFALIHYNTPRVHNYQRGPDYAILESAVPNLVGTKHVGADFPEFCSVVRNAPNLSHFTSEHSFTPFTMFGARGIYSWFANFNAPYMVSWYDSMVAGDWADAEHRQKRMLEFIDAMAGLLDGGNLHGIVGKALASASEFLVPCAYTRKPYLPIPAEQIAAFRKLVELNFRDLQWTG